MSNKFFKYLRLTPFIGVCIFILLYFISTQFYPGGSDVDTSYVGFDWVNNYWCDLTDDITESGADNPARPIAIVAMAILCLSITILSYQVAHYFKNLRFSMFIFYFTTASMIFANFSFSKFHDYSVYLAGIFGIIPLALTFYGLYVNKLKYMFVVGFIAMFFLTLNFLIYKTKIGIIALPMIQKLTFLTFLIWISVLNFRILKKNR